jgi:competence protein ComEA
MQNRWNRFAAVAVAALLALAAAPVAAAEAPSGVVNVNTASAEQLDLLPGVGPAIASRILDYRQKNGAFKSLDDLMLVQGIGEKSFAKMKPYLTLTGSTTLAAAVKSPRAQKSEAKAESGTKVQG